MEYQYCLLCPRVVCAMDPNYICKSCYLDLVNSCLDKKITAIELFYKKKNI